MSMVSEEIVEGTWREVAVIAPKLAQSEMYRFARRQRELLVFVTAMTNALSSDARELATYALFVIYRMFEKSSGSTVRKIRRREIAAAFEVNQEQFERLATSHPRFLQRAAVVAGEDEPYVMRYVTDVAVGDEPDCQIHLTEQEAGELFLYLKTVVDCLHAAAAP